MTARERVKAFVDAYLQLCKDHGFMMVSLELGSDPRVCPVYTEILEAAGHSIEMNEVLDYVKSDYIVDFCANIIEDFERENNG